MFQTGEIREYSGAKQSKLRKMRGGLNTFGVDRDGMMRVVSSYSRKSLVDYQAEAGESAIKRELDKSEELQQIRTILSPLEGKAEVGGADLKSSWNKKIKDMVENGDITYEEI